MRTKGTSWCGRGAVLLCLGALGGCGGQEGLPTPRSVIIFSGARIQADPDEMQEVDRWLGEQLMDIRENPSFMIEVHRQDRRVRMWEALHIEGDTARIGLEEVAVDAETPYLLYAHYHLMAERGELEEWLPEGEDATGLELERTILDRIADAWLLGRSIYDTQAYPPLDELLYSREFGYLEPYILVAQSERFADEHEEWREEDPEELEDFLAWFRDTFERDPPGWTAEEAPSPSRSGPVQGRRESAGRAALSPPGR